MEVFRQRFAILKKILFVILSIVEAPNGIKTIKDNHSDVQIYCEVVDVYLNENAYIILGLGDKGDRVYYN